MSDFEEIMKKALAQDGVDDPLNDDKIDKNHRDMSALERALADTIVDYVENKKTIDDQDALIVLVTMVGKAIATLAPNKVQALHLYVRVCSAIMDVIVSTKP